ncbi:MAG: glycosyltransferase family 2 protein, partial [Patescibacteria group bacterium]
MNSDKEGLNFSVVVPIYNEEGNILSLHQEISSELASLSSKYEIIYINDGSTDRSLEELKSLNKAKIINLNRNYGQATAFDAGFKVAMGDIVISMDGDGQNDPRDIHLLLKKMHDEDLDVVAGWRKVRKDRNMIKVFTRIGRWFRKILIKDIVHDTGCSFRVYKREAVKSLDIGGEMHRYILALLRWKGFSIGEVFVNDRKREYGKSKYNWKKSIKGLIDLIFIWFIHKYSQRPMHLFGSISFVLLLLGFLSGLWTLYG